MRREGKQMSAETLKTEEDIRQLLEAFVVDNTDLERLESLVTQFNIFEAIGAVRQELRHSDFLAFLLDPQQNHGLRDVFVKKLLQKAISEADGVHLPVTPIDLDTWNLEQLEVAREWKNIDILLADEASDLIVAIENKIDTSEHSDQLERYWQTLQEAFPAKRIVGIFLTADGEQASHQHFISVDYGQVAHLIENLVDGRAGGLGSDVRALMLHYAQMLRRHIVSESEIAELCRRIYQKYKQALDLIFDHRPDQQATLREFLETLIKENPELLPDFSNKQCVRFTSKNWESFKLRSGQGWTRSGRILPFECQNLPDSLKVKLIIGPGPRRCAKRFCNWRWTINHHLGPWLNI